MRTLISILLIYLFSASQSVYAKQIIVNLENFKKLKVNERVAIFSSLVGIKQINLKKYKSTVNKMTNEKWKLLNRFKKGMSSVVFHPVYRLNISWKRLLRKIEAKIQRKLNTLNEKIRNSDDENSDGDHWSLNATSLVMINKDTFLAGFVFTTENENGTDWPEDNYGDYIFVDDKGKSFKTIRWSARREP